RPVAPAVLGWAEPGRVWVGDRNCCTTQFLAGTAGRGGCFAVRQHRQTLTEFGAGARGSCGRTETGAVFEEAVRVADGARGELASRPGGGAPHAPAPGGGHAGRGPANPP